MAHGAARHRGTSGPTRNGDNATTLQRIQRRKEAFRQPPPPSVPPPRLPLGNNLVLARANAACLADHNPGQSMVHGVKPVLHTGGRGTSQLRYLLFGVCFSCAGRLCFWAMP